MNTKAHEMLSVYISETFVELIYFIEMVVRGVTHQNINILWVRKFPDKLDFRIYPTLNFSDSQTLYPNNFIFGLIFNLTYNTIPSFNNDNSEVQAQV